MSRLKNYNIEYANFLCHFGNDVLLERYLDIFYPSIISGESRRYGETSFSFIDIKHIILKNSEGTEESLFLYGKIVKDFVYKREQLLDYSVDELKPDHDELRDSPSSTFILNLNDHRLYFIKEFQLGPTLDHFAKLVESLIKLYLKNTVDDIHRSKREMSELNGGTIKVPSKKSLKINFPDPDIQIIRLSSPEGIAEFINSIKTIESFEINLNKTNHESDCSELFKQLREQQLEMGTGAKNKITYTKGKKSLNHRKVIEVAKAASNDNNMNFKVSGKSDDATPMRGTEEEFSVKVPISEIEDTPYMMAKKAFKEFWSLVNKGIIREPRISDIDYVKRKIKNIKDMLDL